MKRVTSLLMLLMFLSTALFSQVNSVSNVLDRPDPVSFDKNELTLKEKLNYQSTITEADQNRNNQIHYQPSDAAWDLQFSEPVGVGGGEAGIESDGTNIYTTKWNGAEFYRYDMAGIYIETFTCGAASDIRDLAFDGTYFYGAAANTTLYEMDFTNEVVISTIAAPVATRAIAYNGDVDGFYANNWSTDITLFDRTGTTISSFSVGTFGSYYGFAYDNFDATGPYLWGFSQDGSGAVVVQMELPSGAETGFTYDVLTDIGVAGDLAGGCAIVPDDIVPGTYSFLGTLQNNLNFAYELGTTVVYTNDVGVSAIMEPVSGYDLTAAEPITIEISNYGTADQSNIPYEVTWGAADGVYNGTYAGPLLAGETVEITLPVTADLSAYGPYTFDACTQLVGDENTANDCKDKTVTNSPAPTLLYPQSADYWTGTTDGTTKTQNSLVIGMDAEDGWFMFDVSSIPPGSLITSITFHGYVYETDWPYWSLTPLYLDPLTASAADLATAITNGEGSGVAYAYNNESSSFAPGWHSYLLEGTANQDLQAALSQGWFAVGMASRDNSPSYFIKFEGWNETNIPYLEVEWEENACVVECPPEGIDEGEPCGDDVNGGCNMATPAFTPIADGDIICGTAWAEADTRDTDWFEVVVANTSTLTFEVTAEFEVVLGMIGQIEPGIAGCDNTTGSLDPYYVASPCETGMIEVSVPAGTYYLFVAPTVYNGLPCTSEIIDYTAALTVTAPETGTLTGTTSDASTGDPLGGVLVEAGMFSAVSSPGPLNVGKYSMTIPVGTYDVVASKDEYHPETVTGFEVVTGSNLLNFNLNPIIAPELLSATPGPGTVTLEWEPIPDPPAMSANNKHTTSAVQVEKPASTAKPNIPDPDVIRQGGDDIASATVVPGIPYTDNGTTAGYTDDYDEVCPYSGSTAPDVVYSFAPASDVTVDIGLCNSLYDTKLYVYENAATPGAPYACNDDACGDDGFKSQVTGVDLIAGNTYYIIVDGYGTESGEYELTIDEFVECVLECPAGGIPEGEECPGDDYVDVFNGGCNSDPPVYSPINCGETICGTASTFLFGTDDYRDTDWYEITLDDPMLLTWSGMAEFPLLLYVLDDPEDCESFTIAESTTAAPCEEASIEIELPAGTYWLFAAPSVFEGYPCGTDNDYYVTVTCEPIVSETTFNIYRDGVLYESEVEGTTYIDESFPSFSDEYCYQVSQIMPDLTESDLSNTLCASPEALPGSTCEDPYFITSIPFEELGLTTEGFGDDYDNTMACGSSYMNGDDYVFSYTPAEDINISVALNNTDSWTGVFITEGCPDVGTCVAFDGSSSGNPFIESAELTAGIEYFIIVSTWPSPQFTVFDILVEENIDGMLTGTVTGPDYRGPVEGVTITADQLRESFTTTTGADGTYELTLPIGTYNVTAEKPGYVTQIVEDVVIEEGMTEILDFMLEFSAPVLLTADPSFYDVSLTWEGNPLFTDPAKDNLSGKKLSIETTRNAAKEAENMVQTQNEKAYQAALAERKREEGSILSLANKPSGAVSPNQTDDDIIRYDDGVNDNAIGLTSGGTFQVAAYFPAATMATYAGMKLDQVEIFVQDVPDPCVLKIYGQGTATEPGPLLHEQTVVPTALSWNLFTLTSQVDITGDDLWIGYEVTHDAGFYPAGIDAGPSVVGFGDMISLDGVTFESLYNLAAIEGNWNIAGYLVEGAQAANDVGVSAIVEPVSGENLTNAEPITITIKNYGTESQSDIPYEVVWGAADGTYTGTFAGPLAGGASADVTLPVTADLSAYGDYNFDACTQLAGDENPANDCKTKVVTNIEPWLCVDGLYTTGCSLGDGLVYWDISNVNVPDIPCTGTPAWYHDYTDMVHDFTAGGTFTLTVQAGYGSTYFDVWIDFNDDLILTNDEIILNDAYCDEGGVDYTFDVFIPTNAPTGIHAMRFRTNWLSPVEDACETYSYGNAADFMAETQYIPCVVECPPEGIDEGEPCGEDLNGGCNMDVPAFTPVFCGDVICGNAWAEADTRDTDWYELNIETPKVVTFTVTAEFPVAMGLIEQIDPGVPGCDNITGYLEPFASAFPCQEISVEVTLIPGTYYFFVAPSVFDGYPCSSEETGYLASWVCEDIFLPYYEVYRDDQVDPIAEVYGESYLDEDVAQGTTYCYEVMQYATPSIILGPSNELCADVPYPPEIVVNPTSLSESLEIGETSTQFLDIDNLGMGDLNWTANINFMSKDGITYVKEIPARGNINNENTEMDENREQVNTDALGDIVFNLDIQTICGDNQLLGCEFDGTYLWVTGAGNSANPNYIYQIDPFAGTLVNTYEQGTTSSWGMRDLAWVEADGLLYAGDGDGFYSIDPADGTVTTVFSPTGGIGTIRALAFDGTNFWTKSFSGDLFEFDIAGNIINTYSPAVASSCYGAAYDHTEGFLYLFSQDDAMFYQFGLDGIHTGVTYDVSAAQPGGIAGGAFYDFGTLVPGKATLGFLLQGDPDIVGAMELYNAGTPWLSIDPTGGTILPAGTQVMDVMFNATDVENGIYNAEINFNSNDPVNPQVTVPVQLIVGGMTQNIFMPMGWSGWSSYINPDARMTMEDLMQPVIDDMIITTYFNQIFYPEYGINNMEEFTNNHGYISKMAAEATLPVNGFMADGTVDLMSGWNVFPVLQECPIPSDDVFGAIPEVVIAFEIAGNGIYYPLYGVSTIGDLEPGMAYYVKTSAEASYTFPGCPKSGGTSVGGGTLRPENTSTWNEVNYTGLSHAVVFTETAISELHQGDVIGAFNSNGVCVGMTPVYSNTASFVMFGDDITTAAADGYTEGEELSFKLYREESGEEFNLDVVYSSSAPNSDGKFAINGASVVTDLTMNATGIGTQTLNGLSVYPNPSNGVFNIEINNLDENITYSVVNSQGQEVYEGQLLETQEVDLSTQPKGIYFIKFMNDQVLRIEKLVIK